jgi:hypothetical protein
MNEQKSAGKAAGSKGLILLADDEKMMQELARELLEGHGYRVLLAGDGAEAVALYQQYAHDIDLVILDLLMPNLDGGQAYTEMRKINKDVRAFFCTGYSPQDVIGTAEKPLRAVQKPFRTDEFMHTVQEVLGQV